MTFTSNHTDVIMVKDFASGLVTFNWSNMPTEIHFIIHLLLVFVLLAIFPISKLLHVPGVFFSVGGTPADLMRQIEAGEVSAPPHHSPFFFIDPNSIKAGVEAMYTAAIYFLNNP